MRLGLDFIIFQSILVENTEYIKEACYIFHKVNLSFSYKTYVHITNMGN